jgi:Protein of unknown function (DUF1566)
MGGDHFMAAARKLNPVEAQPRFVKLDAKGKPLPAAAPEWTATFDQEHKLIWTPRRLPCGAVNWKKAIAEAKKVRLCGWTNWAAPTRVQLLSIIDDTRHSPATNPAFFPDSQSGWEWTSTPYASSPAGCAWLVYFDGGNAGWSYQGGGGFVRAVRASQSLDIGNRA